MQRDASLCCAFHFSPDFLTRLRSCDSSCLSKPCWLCTRVCVGAVSPLNVWIASEYGVYHMVTVTLQICPQSPEDPWRIPIGPLKCVLTLQCHITGPSSQDRSSPTATVCSCFQLKQKQTKQNNERSFVYCMIMVVLTICCVASFTFTQFILSCSYCSV